MKNIEKSTKSIYTSLLYFIMKVLSSSRIQVDNFILA